MDKKVEHFKDVLKSFIDQSYQHIPVARNMRSKQILTPERLQNFPEDITLKIRFSKRIQDRWQKFKLYLNSNEQYDAHGFKFLKDTKLRDK